MGSNLNSASGGHGSLCGGSRQEGGAAAAAAAPGGERAARLKVVKYRGR